MNTKSQVGQTITWFAATLIIFFISFLFLSASSWLTSKKILKEKNEITLETINPQSFQEIQIILNSKIENESLNYLIKKWVLMNGEKNSDELKEKIKESIRKNLINYKDCRIFEIYYGKEIKTIEDFLNNPDKIIVSNTDLNPESVFGRLQRVSETILLINDKSIRTKLYIGEC